jgi:hypothetical protein
MNEQALITRDDARLSASFTPAALALRNAALEVAALIGRVNDAETQEQAVQVQAEITRLLGHAEKARKACKEPVLEFGRRIDDAAKAFVSELKSEQLRLATLVGDFQQVELARVRAENQARNTALTQLEREKAAEISKAVTHEEIDAIQARFNAQAESMPLAQPIKAQGQKVSEVWEIQVTDIWLLARAHPGCVSIEPRVSEIKGLLDAGVKVAGVTAKRVIKSSTTAARQPADIEVSATTKAA